MPVPDDVILTTTEAAELVGRSVRTIQSWSALGLLVPVEKGGYGRGRQNRFRASDVLGAERVLRNRSNAWQHDGFGI